MRDAAGQERGLCAACAGRYCECCEYTYLPYPDDEEDEWELDLTAEEYRSRPLMPGLAERLAVGVSPPRPETDPPCAGCGCPVDAHEVVDVSHEEARALDAARRVLAPLDISTCIRQSVHDTTHLGMQRTNLAYGEVSDLSFLRLLSRIFGGEAAPGRVFYDLGCGSGRAVVLVAVHAAAFRRCVGVEILPGLASIARGVAERYRAEVRGAAEVQCVEGDLFDADISDASLVLLNAGGWEEPMLSRLRAHMLEALPDRCVLITMRKRLFRDADEGVRLVEELELPMSWGLAPAFVAERRRSPGPPMFRLDAMD